MDELLDSKITMAALAHPTSIKFKQLFSVRKPMREQSV
jgi:hypothetical protein